MNNSIEYQHPVARIGLYDILVGADFIIANLVSIGLLCIVLSISGIDEGLRLLYKNTDTLVQVPAILIGLTLAVMAIAFGIFTDEFIQIIREKRLDHPFVVWAYIEYFLYAQTCCLLTLVACMILRGEFVLDWLAHAPILGFLNGMWFYWVVFITVYSLVMIFSIVRLLVELMLSRISIYPVGTDSSSDTKQPPFD